MRWSVFKLNAIFFTPLKKDFFFRFIPLTKIVPVWQFYCFMPVYSSILFAFYNLILTGDIGAPQNPAGISAYQCAIHSILGCTHKIYTHLQYGP